MQPPQFECEHLISDPESFKDGVAALADHLPPRLSRLKLDLGSCAIGDSGVALLQCYMVVHNEACRLSGLIPGANLPGRDLGQQIATATLTPKPAAGCHGHSRSPLARQEYSLLHACATGCGLGKW